MMSFKSCHVHQGILFTLNFLPCHRGEFFTFDNDEDSIDITEVKETSPRRGHVTEPYTGGTVLKKL